MTHIPDLDPSTYNPELHKGVTTLSVGWLGDSVPTRGSLPPAVVEALRIAVQHSYSDHWMGFHTCEICARADGHGEFAIDHEGTRYVASALIIHYVETHDYLPPEPFLEALRSGVLRAGDQGGYACEHRDDRRRPRRSWWRRLAGWIRRR